MDARGYYLAREGARLRLQIAPFDQDGVEVWKVDAGIRDHERADIVTASGTGGSRTEALRDLARVCCASDRERGVSGFDWDRVEALLVEVRAL